MNFGQIFPWIVWVKHGQSHQKFHGFRHLSWHDLQLWSFAFRWEIEGTGTEISWIRLPRAEWVDGPELSHWFSKRRNATRDIWHSCLLGKKQNTTPDSAGVSSTHSNWRLPIPTSLKMGRAQVVKSSEFGDPGWGIDLGQLEPHPYVSNDDPRHVTVGRHHQLGPEEHDWIAIGDYAWVHWNME